MAGPSTTSQSTPEVAPPRRRWFTFRWRILLLIPLAAIVLAAVYGPRQYRQKNALAALKERGAIVRTEPLGLPLVETLAGKEYDQIITEVYWVNADVTDDDLKLLSGLKTLRKLELTGSKVTGAGLEHLAGLDGLYNLQLGNTRVTDDALAHVAELPGLGILSLSGTKVTNAGLKHLAGMEQLERLFLDETSLTDDGLAHLTGLLELKELSLRDVPITDRGLAHLKGLKNLELLKLENTKVTRAGVADLIKSLPKCYVPPAEDDAAGGKTSNAGGT